MAAFPLRNVGLKFLSVCIATLLWLIVAGDRVVERAIRVPIEFQNLPQGLEIVGEPPETVDVRLRASSGTLGRAAGEMAAVIDLRSARAGRRLFHLTPANVKVPYGVEVVQVSPATLPIEFENSAVRVVRIRPSIEGPPAPGYEIVSVTTEPETVEIIGPESALRSLDEAMTEPVSVAGATRSVHEIVTVGVADPNVRLRTPQTASVTVSIAAGNTQRTLEGVPVLVRNAAEGLQSRVSPTEVTLSVRGTKQAMASLTAAVVEAYVDAGGLAPGQHEVDVHASVPQGVTVEAVSPATARIRLIKQ